MGKTASCKEGWPCDQCAYHKVLRKTSSITCCARGNSLEFEKKTPLRGTTWIRWPL